MNPKSDLLHIEEGQLADLQLDGENLFPIVCFGRIENVSYDFGGYGEFVHGYVFKPRASITSGIPIPLAAFVLIKGTWGLIC